MTQSALVVALRQALSVDAANGPLWAHLADLLLQSGDDAGALDALRNAIAHGSIEHGAIEHGQDQSSVMLKFVGALRRQGFLAEALIRAEESLKIDENPALRVELARILLAREDESAARQQYQQAIAAEPAVGDSILAEQLGCDTETLAGEGVGESGSDEVQVASEEEAPLIAMCAGAGDEAALDELDWQQDLITFKDVVGLDDVKRQIHLRIVAPFREREIFKAFSRKAGGGILLYGPPGCGKTYIARAAAGEVGAQFIAVGIHDIVDKYFGEAEKMVHRLFEQARRRSPSVLFFDEFDALGGNRRGGESQFWKTLVDQLLQEMDGIGSRNENVLVFAATNAPWNIDSAFRRPGRFDRTLFIPPPDLEAREEMLRRYLHQLPGGDTIAVSSLAASTPLLTGADLRSLCERASENALSRSLESGKVHPVMLDDFRHELRSMRSSAEEWLATAKNYARYSNDGGQYDELTAFLKRVKRW